MRSSSFYRFLINVPSRYSRKAVSSSAWVFMTMGPRQATGSFNGFPVNSKNLRDSPGGADGHLFALVEQHQGSVFN
jgi:hypothetical protein